jgi:hypothetical protein
MDPGGIELGDDAVDLLVPIGERGKIALHFLLQRNEPRARELHFATGAILIDPSRHQHRKANQHRNGRGHQRADHHDHAIAKALPLQDDPHGPRPGKRGTIGAEPLIRFHRPVTITTESQRSVNICRANLASELVLRPVFPRATSLV